MSDAFQPGAEFRRQVERRAQQLRRRRLWRASGAAVIAAAVGVAALVSSGGPGTTIDVVSPSSTGTPATSPTTSVGPTKSVVASEYEVSFRIPASWTPTPGYASGTAESGPTGFEVVDAGFMGHSLHSACHIVTINALHPYGTSPRLRIAEVDDHPACFITPSADAPASPARKDGPKFRDAALVLQYRKPLAGGFEDFLLNCDADHLDSIAATIKILDGY